MKRYTVTLTGANDLLLHHDNLRFSERLIRWRKDPANKELSVPGDDRSPAWTWMGCLYIEAGKLVIPSDNLMTVLREGAKRVSTGKRGTFKSQSQSGILIDQSAWPLLVEGKAIAWSALQTLENSTDYQEHEEAVRKLGFELFAKRAKIGNAKHVRVRPRFSGWSCSGTVTILDPSITADVLRDIVTQAGRFAGIGDWRPSSPKSPGPFGTFTATVEAA